MIDHHRSGHGLVSGSGNEFGLVTQVMIGVLYNCSGSSYSYNIKCNTISEFAGLILQLKPMTPFSQLPDLRRSPWEAGLALPGADCLVDERINTSLVSPHFAC